MDASTRIISSKHFTWSGGKGCTEVSSLTGLNFDPFNGNPITVVSARTQDAKVFRVDRSIPGWEDGWDGESCHYVSDDGIKIAFFND